MSMAISSVWHFNQEDLVVHWAGGRVVAVKAMSAKSPMRRAPSAASDSTPRSQPARKTAVALYDQRIAA